MAIRSGLASSLAFSSAGETTWGTAATVDRWLEFVKEGFALDIDRVESKALRQNNRVLRGDRWVAGKRTVTGDIDFEVMNKGFGFLLKAILGSSSSNNSGGVYTYTFTLGDPYGTSYTIEVGRPDVNGTVQQFLVSGAKVEEATFKNSLDGLLELSTKWTAKDQATSGSTTGGVSYPAATEPFSWTGGSININSVAQASVKDITWTIKPGIKSDRYAINSSRTIREQIIADMVEISGSITAEFESLTSYNLFVNASASNLYQVDATWSTDSFITGSTPFQLGVTMPKCRFEPAKVNVEGPDILTVELPFKALNPTDGSTQPITMTYKTSDTAI